MRKGAPGRHGRRPDVLGFPQHPPRFRSEGHAGGEVPSLSVGLRSGGVWTGSVESQMGHRAASIELEGLVGQVARRRARHHATLMPRLHPEQVRWSGGFRGAFGASALYGTGHTGAAPWPGGCFGLDSCLAGGPMRLRRRSVPGCVPPRPRPRQPCNTKLWRNSSIICPLRRPQRSWAATHHCVRVEAVSLGRLQQAELKGFLRTASHRSEAPEKIGPRVASFFFKLGFQR
jgi:hypothetical protein